MSPRFVVVPPTYTGKSSILIFKEPSDRRRLFYILLGITLGCFGAHNFYAGYKSTAVTQLLFTVLSLGTLSFFVSLWALYEVFSIKTDAEGRVMEMF